MHDLHGSRPCSHHAEIKPSGWEDYKGQNKLMEKETILGDEEMVGPAAVWLGTTAEDGSR